MKLRISKIPDLYNYDDKLVVSTFPTPNDNNDHPVYDWCTMGWRVWRAFDQVNDPVTSVRLEQGNSAGLAPVNCRGARIWQSIASNNRYELAL